MRRQTNKETQEGKQATNQTNADNLECCTTPRVGEPVECRACSSPPVLLEHLTTRPKPFGEKKPKQNKKQKQKSQKTVKQNSNQRKFTNNSNQCTLVPLSGSTILPKCVPTFRTPKDFSPTDVHSKTHCPFPKSVRLVTILGGQTFAHSKVVNVFVATLHANH